MHLYFNILLIYETIDFINNIIFVFGDDTQYYMHIYYIYKYSNNLSFIKLLILFVIL